MLSSAKEKRTTYHLEGTVRILEPLSHISGTTSTGSRIVKKPVEQPDGTIEEVPAVSGNSWRHKLREGQTEYMIAKLGITGMTKEALRLFFAGGNIDPNQKQINDLAYKEQISRLFPCLANLGGALGNMMLESWTDVGWLWPVCKQTAHIIPERVHLPHMPDAEDLIEYEENTRMDPVKVDRLARHLLTECRQEAGMLPEGQQAMLLPSNDTGEPQAEAQEKSQRSKEAASMQMRYGGQVLATGAVLFHRLKLREYTDLQLGAFVTGLMWLTSDGVLGGKRGAGHGRSEFRYEFREEDYTALEKKPLELFFFAGPEGVLEIAPAAEEAKRKYDAHLEELKKLVAKYDEHLLANIEAIKGLMIGEGGKADGAV